VDVDDVMGLPEGSAGALDGLDRRSGVRPNPFLTPLDGPPSSAGSGTFEDTWAGSDSGSSDPAYRPPRGSVGLLKDPVQRRPVLVVGALHRGPSVSAGHAAPRQQPRPDEKFHVERPAGRTLAVVPDLAPLAGTAHEPTIHARQRLGVPAICGQAPGIWTTKRYAVTCAACRAEIEKRLAAGKAYR
jgi:hypothetical protein